MGVRLRVGIVGIGPAWDSCHSPALRALGDRFEVRAFCDPVVRRVEMPARQWGAQALDGFRAITHSDDVDAILLLSASWYGALPIMAACEAGKAVYCAASLDLSAEEASRVRERIRDAGIAFMAEFKCRLAPATLRLKELIATRLGAPRLLFCNQRISASRTNGNPQSTNIRKLVEMVDWCRYVVGRDPSSVVGACQATQQDGGGEDYLVMSLDFSASEVGAGPMAQIGCGSYVSQSWREAAAYRRPADLQVICEGGIAFLDLPNTLVWFDDAGQHTESLESDRPVGEQLLLHFHRAVSSLVLQTSNLDDAYKALSIVINARQSYLDGRRIECAPAD